MAASGSALSRRVSEVVGVALFAVGADLADRAGDLRPERSGLVLQHRHARRAGELRRPRRRVPRRAVVPGPRLRLVPDSRARSPSPAGITSGAAQIDAVYTKLIGAALLLACSSAFLSLTLGRVDFGPRAFRAGGYLGEWLGGFMSEYLSRTGSVIVILTLMVAAVILATQFSFGRLFSAIFAGRRQRRRRRASWRSGSGARSAARRSSAAR